MPETAKITFEDALGLQRRGENAAAETVYRKILELEPDHADALNNLALLCKQAGDKAEAESLYRRSLAARQDNPEVCSNLGVLLMEGGRLEESEAVLRQAIALRPAYAEAWNNLGNVLQGQRRYDEAFAAYGEILRYLPARLREVGEAARKADANGQKEEAERLVRQARGLRSTIVESCWNLSLLHLLLGRYAEAWPLHEARYDSARLHPVPVPPGLPCPPWRGEPLAGKAILVWFEQGMGDEIQFVRYVTWLKRQGARRVTLVCKAALLELFKSVDGVDGVFAAEGQQLVIPAQDYWVLPMSLPLHHRTTLDNIPAQLPYLRALPERVTSWAGRLPVAADGLRVGLAWAGSVTHRNDANRSLPSLQLLAPLAAIPGVKFISLQKGERETEAAPVGFELLRIGPELGDFADTAAVISQLDLVITVDTAVAHVAGALGKPCWVLLPWLGVDWRWLIERDDSPWYPGALRLFRQTATGEWASVVRELTAALQTLAPATIALPDAGKQPKPAAASKAKPAARKKKTRKN